MSDTEQVPATSAAPAAACCGAAAPTPAPDREPCCGTAAEAVAEVSCCGRTAKARLVAAGADCCA